MGKGKLFYGYYMVLLGFIIQVVGLGLYGAYGVFFAPLLDEFGWSRAAISGAGSLLLAMWGFFSVLVGGLNDRFGPRITLMLFGFFWGQGYLLLSRVNAVWQLYLYYGVLVSMGLSAVDVLPLTTVARWFVKRRGMMSGIVKAGAGLGIFIAPLVANWLITSYGWRSSFLIIGVVAIVLSLAVAQLLKRDPSKLGLAPYGEKEVALANTESQNSGLSLRGAVRTSQFWMLCTVYLIVVFCCDAILVHIVPHALDLGFTSASAASILGAIGGASIAGRFIMGSASDRTGMKLMMVVCFALLGIGFLWLQIARELWMLYVFAILDGFAHGGLFTLISPWVAELFGLTAHGAIFGAVGFVGLVGGALGPLFFGYIFDVTGSYQLALIVGAALSVIAIIMALFVRPIAKAKPVA